MQEFFLWPLSKCKALSCGSTRLLGPLFFFQSVSGSEKLSDFRLVRECDFFADVVSPWAQLVSFLCKIRLNKAFRFFNFLQQREGERLSWFAFSSRRGTTDREWLCCPRIDRDEFWFSSCWAGFVRRGKSMFAVLKRGILAVDVFAVLMKWQNLPKIRIFRPHGLQTRSEYCIKWTNGNPTT